jgi:hypothetical protein
MRRNFRKRQRKNTEVGWGGGRKWHRVRWLLIIDPKVQFLWAARKSSHGKGWKIFLGLRYREQRRRMVSLCHEG